MFLNVLEIIAFFAFLKWWECVNDDIKQENIDWNWNFFLETINKCSWEEFLDGQNLENYFQSR